MPTYTKFETINPYGDMAGGVALGLADITTNLTSPYPYEDLENDTLAYVITLMGITTSAAENQELKSLIAFGANDYNNNQLDGYTESQQFFIGNLLSGLTGLGGDPDSILLFLKDIEDNISKCGLSVEEQRPLLMAVAVGMAVGQFWTIEIANSSSLWYTTGYFNANSALNSAMVPYWVGAAMHGTLTAANKARVPSGLYDPSSQSSTPNLISVITGSIGVAAGKVLYKWVPRMTVTRLAPLALNKDIPELNLSLSLYLS